MPTLTRTAAGLSGWAVEVNADVGAEHRAPVRVSVRSTGTLRLTGAGLTAMIAALNTYYSGGKAAMVLAATGDRGLTTHIARDAVWADVLAADKESVVSSFQTVLLTSGNTQVG